MGPAAPAAPTPCVASSGRGGPGSDRMDDTARTIRMAMTSTKDGETCAGRTLVWVLLGGVAVVALALVMLLGDDGAPEGDGGGRLVDGGATDLTDTRLPEPADERPDRDREPEPVRTGLVTGRVVFADRRPVPNARVDARQGAGLDFGGVLPDLPSLGVRAVSDETGWFELADVPATEALRLRLEGDAFSIKDVGPYTLTAGAVLDVGDVIVEPGVMVRGVTIDDRGLPVPGAQVELHYDPTSGDWGWNRSTPARAVLSDDEGRFTLANVRRGGFVLRASKEGHAGALSRHFMQPGDNASELHQTLTLGKPGIIRGQVVAIPDDTPLAGARVVATPGTENREADSAETVTDENGEYVLDTLVPGTYAVQARVTGFKRQGRMVKTDDEPRAGRLRLNRNGSVSGYVLGEGGEPMRFFDLQLLLHQNDYTEGYKLGGFRRFQTKDGRFVLDDLQRDFYSVEIWAKGYAVTASETFLLTQGEQLEGLVIELEKGAMLAGRVVDPSGAGVADATVSMHFNQESSVDWLRGSFGPQAWLRSGTTDEDGRFELEGLTAGTFQIEVAHPDYSIYRRNDVAVLKDQRNELSEPFVLTPGGSLSGAALDATGLARAGVEVHLNGPDGLFMRMRTDGRGQFRFERLPPGRYRLRAVSDRQATLAEALGSETGRTNNPFAGSITLGPGEHRRENAPLAW